MESFFGIILSIVFGAIFGSYATLFAYRLPRQESCFGRYFGPKSRCPKCGITIITRDLIPLINWIITFGKCRNCKNKIPRIHLFVEITTTILFLICYLNFSFSEKFIIYAMISVSLVVLLACDITHKIFPQPVFIFLLFFITIDRVIDDQTILNIIYSAIVGVIIVSIFIKIFSEKLNYFFSNKTQLYDYSKFILIASLGLNYLEFLYYSVVVMVILTFLSAIHILGKKNPLNFGYVFIIPYIWTIFLINN